VNPYRKLFAALNDSGINYLVVGGVAVNLHGFRRFTADVDILLALDETNLHKMTSVMHSLYYVERLPVQLQALNDPEKIRQFLDQKGMTAYTFLSDARERIDVDVLAAASLSFDKYATRKVILDIDDDVKVPVISFDDLIALKRKANREKDIEDVRMLLELKGL
jgi:predicted nucleotidyltransferase